MFPTTMGAKYMTEKRSGLHVEADYEGKKNGGNGYLRILTFSPANNLIHATTYSAYDGTSLTAYPDQMDMVYDMSGVAPSVTPAMTETPMETGTPTDTATITATFTITKTPTVTYTPTETGTPTATRTPTMTHTPTQTRTTSPTSTWTYTPTASNASTRTSTPAPTDTLTPTSSPTPTVTDTPTVTSTPTSTQITYSMTIISEHGLVTRNIPGPYHDGDVVWLTAQPDANWDFSGWSGDVTGKSNPIAVTMNSDKRITASYTRKPYRSFIPLVAVQGERYSPASRIKQAISKRVQQASQLQNLKTQAKEI
jgi:hypothetical protein